jgi:protoporphyrinogen oxidase
MQTLEADFFISTMPVKDLINALNPAPAGMLKEIANGLEYRDFITVGLLVKELELKDGNGKPVKDNWIYIQDKEVKIGRLQIFNNWSPHLVNDPSTIWLGLEYFCRKDDSLWSMQDKDILQLAEKELVQLGIIKNNVVLDGTVVKVEKAYPGYFGTYDQIPILREYTDQFENLFLIGRNGMHRYNNQDHSMLTAMEAVTKIIEGNSDKSSIWAINTEDEYHEET